jgi:probable rRNA maturation factor
LGFLDAELSITLVDDREIAELSGRFGRARAPTDVLAFPLREGPGAEHRGPALGDVVISVERARAQARARRATLDAELSQLLIHGVLHLLGLDHDRAAEARAMRELEAHLRWEIARGLAG